VPVRRSPRITAALNKLRDLSPATPAEISTPKLFVPLDASGRAARPKVLDKSEAPALWNGSKFAYRQSGFPIDVKAASFSSTAFDRDMIVLVAGLGGQTAPNGGIWKDVNPSRGGSGVNISRNGAIDLDAPDGSSAGYDLSGGRTYKGADGTTIQVFPGGSDILYQRMDPDGSTSVHNTDGTTDHVSPDGNDDYTDWGNGKRTYYDPDGSERIVDMNDGSQSIQGDGMRVDIPPPVSKPAGDKPAMGTGEPHYLTRDGTAITTQAAGEFVLVTGVSGHTIQARQEPWRNPPEISDKASAITAMAFDAGGARIEVRESGEVMIDGELADANDFERADLPQGGAVGVWRDKGQLKTVVIVWPDLSIVTINRAWYYLSFTLQWSQMEPNHRGLLGSNDGNPANDLIDRGGNLKTADDEGIAAFVDSWRLSDAESLFTYAPGQSTATFTQRDFPKVKAKADLAASPGADGLREGSLRDFYAYDIALTGDAHFLDGYVQIERQFRASENRASDLGPRLNVSTAGASPPGASAAHATATAATIALSSAEMASAQAVPSGEEVAVLRAFAPSESVVYKLSFSEASSHTIQSYTPGPKESDYTAGQSGYAFFAPDGVMIGKTMLASGGERSVSLPAGTVYFKIVGAASSGVIDLKLR